MPSTKAETAIVGVGISEITRGQPRVAEDIALEAALRAMADAGLGVDEIDGLASDPGRLEYEGDQVLVSSFMNRIGFRTPPTWYAQVSDGLIGSAVIEAIHALVAGACHWALVWRVLNQPAYGPWTDREVPGLYQFSAPYGFSSVIQAHAAAYRRYLHRYGATRQDMATLVTRQRANAQANPDAYFRDKKLSTDDYLAAPWVADPFCLYDCDIPVQGAWAIVMTTATRASALGRNVAYFRGYSQQTKRMIGADLVYTLNDYIDLGGDLAHRLFGRAGVGPDDISVAEIYDGFSSLVYYWLEAAGFCGPGEAAGYIQDGRVGIGGDFPINTHGGSLSEGRSHGIGHLIEAARQVTGTAGERQVEGAELAVALLGAPTYHSSGFVLAATQ